MASRSHTAGLILPRALQGRLETAARAMTEGSAGPAVDFTRPASEAALAPADGVSWQVFRNPVSLFVGGVAAVLLELAEPRVRSGVWEHSSFRTDPMTRLRRTGLAAMVTVYGARSVAEAMIAGVGRMHRKVAGETPAGAAYRADDPELLDWVQATAGYGFVEAYSAYVRPLSEADRDRFYAEGRAAAGLYGATGAPVSLAGQRALFAAMGPRLEAHPIVFEFLEIMRRTDILPGPMRALQGMLIRAAVEIVPAGVRETLGLGRDWRLKPWEAALVRLAGRTADRVVLKASPAVQACRRLGLSDDYLLRKDISHGR